MIASVDTHLRFAEAVNRLDLQQTSNAKSVPDLIGGGSNNGSDPDEDDDEHEESS